MPTVLDELQALDLERAAKFIRAFVESDDAIQESIRELLDVLNDPETDEDDKVMTLHTLADALFPNFHKGTLGMDLAESEEDAADVTPELRKIVTEMDEEEATFAERLGAVMSDRGLTQQELAALVGVGQPAISNILNRECRPQHRTVLKIAEALEMPAGELWPSGGD